ncbi:dihydrolipoamide acetyltransferase family protein [Actinocatenispora rupis]|uniref:Dihydrolipoamide acetyltransferase component of pyruvate dehydrogenase complex n=1 Tax=Actinocatenispora rupis TaxID=519421 RepID=A0A8J3J7A9_9ACTN|nr:dihydrolipoamide acetyltransferase family protein [Actinocatenispora rupis]GID13345.1 dihydrolipoamide acetyltransferase component of pyruvate dehydrogenase complex [Actinocatenispora rupis]
MSRVKQFPLPDLGEGLTEGEILKWFVAPGDTVSLNQPIVEVETAKAAVEIPSPYSGVIVELFHGEGATVDVGAPIMSFDTDPGAGPLSEAAPAEAPAAPTTGPLIGEESADGRTAVLVGYGPKASGGKRRPRRTANGAPVSAPVAPTVPATPPAAVTPPAPVAPPVPAHAGPVLAKPPVRKLAKDLGVDLRTVAPTGPNGTISRDDVTAAHAAATATPAAAPAVRPSFGPDREQRVPIKGVRKLTAENMVASAFTAPHVTEFLTVDATRTVKAVERLRAMRDWRDVRVSPLLLVAKAVLLAVRRHPMVNSTWDAERGEIVVKEYVNLGIAAATDRGLIVPNIADAGRLSMRELADAMTDLVETAKSGRTAPAAMQGGTFTITNVGVFGVDTGTPILPPGEAAILAFGAIRQQPWVHKGKVKPRHVTTLGLSFDHRIVDGELGSRFLADIGRFLTDPEATLLAWD